MHAAFMTHHSTRAALASTLVLSFPASPSSELNCAPPRNRQSPEQEVPDNDRGPHEEDCALLPMHIVVHAPQANPSRVAKELRYPPEQVGMVCRQGGIVETPVCEIVRVPRRYGEVRRDGQPVPLSFEITEERRMPLACTQCQGGPSAKRVGFAVAE